MKTMIALFIFSAHVAQAAGIPEDENIQDLLEGQQELKSLEVIQRMGLNDGATKLDLWSGHYWPHYQGALGVRYREPNFKTLISRDEKKFGMYKKITEKWPTYSFKNEAMNLLSPAEKYDLLVGDYTMAMTKFSWELGSGMVSAVPTWRGICDGWSSATQMMPRPIKSVEMTSPSGQKITFFPEDIKALGSQLYARNQENPIFLGKRCSVKIPNPFSNACNPTNPGSFHKALVNRVGKLGKSFIADIDPSTQVWNYPVKSYSVTYYNVLSNEESKNFKDVVELFKDHHRFKKGFSRHNRTGYIVGVEVKVKYQDMRPAPLSVEDGAEYDKVLTKTYDYDLELDYSYNILGGVASAKNLPDFIWAPNDGEFPLSTIEQEQGIARNDKEIFAQARESSKNGEPLSVIVKELFELSK